MCKVFPWTTEKHRAVELTITLRVVNCCMCSSLAEFHREKDEVANGTAVAASNNVVLIFWNLLLIFG
jgi:hypothetical protein